MGQLDNHCIRRLAANRFSMFTNALMPGTTQTVSPLNASRQTKPGLQVLGPKSPAIQREGAMAFSEAARLRDAGATHTLSAGPARRIT